MNEHYKKYRKSIMVATKNWKKKRPGYWREYYYSNKKICDDRGNRFRIKLKHVVFEHYGSKCACCGESNVLFLTIDHVNNDGKYDVTKTGRRLSGTALYTKILKLSFPKKYQILCFNCNFGKNINKGICPHDVELDI